MIPLPNQRKPAHGRESGPGQRAERPQAPA